MRADTSCLQSILKAKMSHPLMKTVLITFQLWELSRRWWKIKQNVNVFLAPRRLEETVWSTLPSIKSDVPLKGISRSTWTRRHLPPHTASHQPSNSKSSSDDIKEIFIIFLVIHHTHKRYALRRHVSMYLRINSRELKDAEEKSLMSKRCLLSVSSYCFQDNVNINEGSNGWIYIFFILRLAAKCSLYIPILPRIFARKKKANKNMYLIIIQHSSNWWNNQRSGSLPFVAIFIRRKLLSPQTIDERNQENDWGWCGAKILIWFTYRSLASWKAEEHVGTVSVWHLTKDVQKFCRMPWLE